MVRRILRSAAGTCRGLALLLTLCPSVLAQNMTGTAGAAAGISGATFWRTLSAYAADMLNVQDYGVVPDGYTAMDGAIEAGSKDFTAASRACVASDAGKIITIAGAGPVDANGALDPLVTTVANCSGNAFVLAAAAATTAGNALWGYGTDNSAALEAAISSNPRATLYMPPGDILLANTTIALFDISLECSATPSQSSPNGTAIASGNRGTTFLLTSLTTVPFWLTPSVRVHGCTFFWPGQAGIGRNPGFYPGAPGLTAGAGGGLAAATDYVEETYVTAAGESPVSAEQSLAVPAGDLLTVASPPALPGVTGYNVYVGDAPGAETKQNASPIAIGTNWTEATSGLISGAAPPPPFIPVAYPPLFESNGSLNGGGLDNDELSDNTVINGYDFLVQCMGAGNPVPSCQGADRGGDLRFANDRIYAVHRVFTLNNIGEAMALTNFQSAASIFTQSPAGSGIAGNLVAWTQGNGSWLRVFGSGTATACDTAHTVAGIAAGGITVADYHRLIHVAGGNLDQATIDDGSLSRVASPLVVDNSGTIEHTRFGNGLRYYAGQTLGGGDNAAAFQINTTCAGMADGQNDVAIAGTVADANGSIIDVEGAAPLNLRADGLSAFHIGSSATAGACHGASGSSCYYFARINDSNPATYVTLDHDFVQTMTNNGQGYGVLINDAPGAAHIADSTFLNVANPIDTTGDGANPIYVSANSSQNTQSANSIVGNSTNLSSGPNNWDVAPTAAAVRSYAAAGASGNPVAWFGSNGSLVWSGSLFASTVGGGNGNFYSYAPNNTLDFEADSSGPSNADHIAVTAAASGGTPSVNAVGSDANISIGLNPKGTGSVVVNGNLNSPNYRTLESFGASITAADNSAAIEAALDSGKPIFVDGWFHITNPISVNACPTVIGQGPEMSGIYSDAAGANVTITCPLTLSKAVTGLVHLERFGIVTTVAQSSATALSVHMGSQMGNNTNKTTLRVEDLEIAGDDNGATHYWQGGILLTNAEDFNVAGNWIQGSPAFVASPYPAGSFGIKITNDPNVGAYAGTIARNVVNDWDKAFWVVGNGSAAVEGLVFRDNTAVVANHAFYIDGSGASYYPPSFVFKNNQTNVNDESIWLNHVAQVFISDNTLYGALPSSNGIVETNVLDSWASENFLLAGQLTGTAAGGSGDTLNLQSAVSGIALGQSVYDATHPSAIPAGTTVSSINGTAIGLSGSAAAVGSGDAIYFDSGTAIVLSGTQEHEELDNSIGVFATGISADGTSYNGGVRGGLSNAMVQTNINPAAQTSQFSLTGGGGGNGWTLTNGLDVASGPLTVSGANMYLGAGYNFGALDNSFLLGGDANGDLVLGKGSSSLPYITFQSAHTGANYDVRVQSLGSDQLSVLLNGGATAALTMTTTGATIGTPLTVSGAETVNGNIVLGNGGNVSDNGADFLLGGDGNGDLVLGKGGSSLPYITFQSAHNGINYDARLQSLASDQLSVLLNGGGTTALNMTTNTVAAGVPVALPAYTVATLPACNATRQNAMAVVTDFSGTPAYDATIGSGGGSTRLPVFCNGTAWTLH